MGKLLEIDVNLIRPNPVSLRQVDKECESYLGLVQSIKQKGFSGAIQVRLAKDKETGVEYYELINGLHRWNACLDAGVKKINVDVMELTEQQMLEAQLMLNIHTVETKNADYAKQLTRILDCNPAMTAGELANNLGKSLAWLNARLGLAKIANPEIDKLINDGKITLSNGTALARLPVEEQNLFVERAITEPPTVFVPAVHARLKELRDAKKAGRDANPVEWTPTAHVRKLSELKDGEIVKRTAQTLTSKLGVNDPISAFELAVQWVLNLDPVTVAEMSAKHKAEAEATAKLKAEREEAKAKAKAEKLAKQAEETAKAAKDAALAVAGAATV